MSFIRIIRSLISLLIPGKLSLVLSTLMDTFILKRTASTIEFLETRGELKIKKTSVEESCEAGLGAPGDLSVKNLRGLQFEVTEDNIALLLTKADYRVHQWSAPRLNKFKKEKVRESLSSAGFKALKYSS